MKLTETGTPHGILSWERNGFWAGSRQTLPYRITEGLPVIQLQSTGKVSSRVSAGQKQLVKFRQASSRYGQGENACCGIALVHDLWTPDLFSLIGSYPQE